MSTRRRWLLVIATVSILLALALIAGGLRADRARGVDSAAPPGTSDYVLGGGTASYVAPEDDLTEVWHPKPWPTPNLEWTPVFQYGHPETMPWPPTPCNPCP